MPSPSLVMHEWDRHGTCSGLSAAAYFETVRKARAVVKIPTDYLDLAAPVSVTPDEVAEAFVKINPGLARADMAVACDKTRLTEVRLCMAQGLFVPCLPRDRAPRLQARQGRNAGDARAQPHHSRIFGGRRFESAIALSRH